MFYILQISVSLSIQHCVKWVTDISNKLTDRYLCKNQHYLFLPWLKAFIDNCHLSDTCTRSIGICHQVYCHHLVLNKNKIGRKTVTEQVTVIQRTRNRIKISHQTSFCGVIGPWRRKSKIFRHNLQELLCKASSAMRSWGNRFVSHPLFLEMKLEQY